MLFGRSNRHWLPRLSHRHEEAYPVPSAGANATQGPVQSSGDTFGMLGPGGPGMMMMGPMGGGGPMGGPSGGSTGPGMDMGAMGMMGAGAMPMNMMAGQTSMYMVSLPIIKQIPSGGKIIPLSHQDLILAGLSRMFIRL